MPKELNIKIGEMYQSNRHGEMIITGFKDYSEVEVMFLKTGYSATTQLGNIRRGNVKDPYDRNIYGVGFLGEGQYKYTNSCKGCKLSNAWKNMLGRCYDPKNKDYDRYHTKEVTVHENWHNFQNFAKWYLENYIDGYQIDKDLKIIGNNVYSEDTCVFVPARINSLLCGSNKSRGEYPIGVHKAKNGKYKAAISLDGKSKPLGSFDTPEEAFNKYKECKQVIIKQMALEYYSKGMIPEPIYHNLVNYEIQPYPL